jgi:hypothetical protein
MNKIKFQRINADIFIFILFYLQKWVIFLNNKITNKIILKLIFYLLENRFIRL